MKKFFSFILTVIIVAVLVFFGMKLIQRCDSCDSIFVGTGYEANIISDALKDGDQTICKKCAEEQHKVETALGKDLEDFKKPLFD